MQNELLSVRKTERYYTAGYDDVRAYYKWYVIIRLVWIAIFIRRTGACLGGAPYGMIAIVYRPRDNNANK